MQANETVPRADQGAIRRDNSFGLPLGWRQKGWVGRIGPPRPRVLLVVVAAIALLLGAATALGSLVQRFTVGTTMVTIASPAGPT